MSSKRDLPSSAKKSHGALRADSHSTNTKVTDRENFVKQAWIVLGACALVGVSIGGWLIWERVFPTQPERVINIYRLHGCGCTFAWARSLQAAGWEVRVQEVETLQHIRNVLHTTPDMDGCHVAKYMSYFVEGHAWPEVLRKLAQEKPAALGVAIEIVKYRAPDLSIAAQEDIPVLVYSEKHRELMRVSNGEKQSGHGIELREEK